MQSGNHHEAVSIGTGTPGGALLVDRKGRLIHYEQAACKESGIVTDLGRLTSPSDGYTDNVASLSRV